MSDIVERLRDYVLDDHERGCQGRYYDCSCGYDGKRDPLMGEAAAEIERLRAGGCARDQGTTQYCAEAAKLAAENERLRAWNREIAVNAKAFAEALREIADFDTDEDISNEECMRDIARAALEGRT